MTSETDILAKIYPQQTVGLNVNIYTKSQLQAYSQNGFGIVHDFEEL